MYYFVKINREIFKAFWNTRGVQCVLHLWLCLDKNNTVSTQTSSSTSSNFPQHCWIHTLSIFVELTVTTLLNYAYTFCGMEVTQEKLLGLTALWIKWAFIYLLLLTHATKHILKFCSGVFSCIQFFLNKILEPLKLSFLILHFTMQSDMLADWVCKHY